MALPNTHFWHSNLRDNCESAYNYVFHLTCVMSYLVKRFRQVTLRRQTKQSNSKTPNSTIKTPQNVLNVSTVSPDASRETATIMAATTIEWSSFLIRLTRNPTQPKRCSTMEKLLQNSLLSEYRGTLPVLRRI